jgi:structural maintenance of chromosome 2
MRNSTNYCSWDVLMASRDDSFNSITGLNGSGKSNILDAICFVLGITHLNTVRAQNLQVHDPDQASQSVANMAV